ncbi:unnamed protein product [Adineta steineri]|uniref:Uncharacterized protein n=1 Tax=Adineta steineri TaxID=433720 RepID=A0A818VBT4_9BILA|nr:unnamed protein product [Adineta steineri]CAF3703988.1 unnamed protein product [Adineta steineri]
MTDQHNEIRHEIYPKLEKYYSSKGYILQIVDMRWGFVYNLKSLENDDSKTQVKTNDNRSVFEIFRNNANNVKLDEENFVKYTKSVTEVEIQEGLFKTIDFNLKCLAFFRHVNIFNQIKQGIIHLKFIDTYNKYIDINQNIKEIDYNYCEEMIFNNLKERITKETSQKRNYKQFIVDINSISELKRNKIKNENFQNYLIEFMDLFECIIVDSIEANINKNEILFHALESYADLFVIFDFVMKKLKSRVYNNEHQIFIVLDQLSPEYGGRKLE